MCAAKARRRRKKVEPAGCCGRPVPEKAPRDGLCQSTGECAQAMKVLAEPSRLQITRALVGGPRSVSQIVEATGLKLHSVSHHLGRMRLAGLVDSVRDGRNVVYSIRQGIATEWGLDFGCCCILFRKLPPR